MKLRRFGIVTLACILMVGCLGMTARAECLSENNTVHYDTTDEARREALSSNVIGRAMQTINTTVSANMVGVADESFPLEAEEIVKLNCTYSPDSASIDFGLIAPDGTFYFINSTSGSIHQSIKVGKRGDYTLAIRNNSSGDVSIAGYVYY